MRRSSNDRRRRAGSLVAPKAVKSQSSLMLHKRSIDKEDSGDLAPISSSLGTPPRERRASLLIRPHVPPLDSKQADHPKPHLLRNQSRFRARSSSFSFPDELSDTSSQSVSTRDRRSTSGTGWSMSEAFDDVSFPQEAVNEILKMFVTDLDLVLDVLSLSDANLIETYVALFSRVGCLQVLIDRMLVDEFTGHTGDKEAILRGNSHATKIMSNYSLRCATGWIKQCLTRTARKTLIIPDLLVVDSSKGKGSAEEAHQGRLAVMGLATHLLRSMEKEIDNAPRALRCMCYLVHRHAMKTCPENAYKLLGGFILLRLINPVLTNPDSVSLLSATEKELSKSWKRNLLTLSKLVQMLSNNKKYREASEMHECNKWLESNYPPLCDILKGLCEDPNYDQPSPFADMLKMPAESDLGDLTVILGMSNWDTLHGAVLGVKTDVLLRAKVADIEESPRDPAGKRRGSRKGPSGRSRRGTLTGSPRSDGTTPTIRPANRRESVSIVNVSSMFDFAGTDAVSESHSSRDDSPRSESSAPPRSLQVQRFYEILSHIDAPRSVREKDFREKLEMCQREALLEADVLVLHEDKSTVATLLSAPKNLGRVSKVAQRESERLAHLAIGMHHEEFGLTQVFTAPQMYEWADRFLNVTRPSECEFLLSCLLKKKLIQSKGRGEQKMYACDAEKIDTFRNLYGNPLTERSRKRQLVKKK